MVSLFMLLTLDKSEPQAAEAVAGGARGGTAEAVPFPNISFKH